MKLFQVDAFTGRRFHGNPAAVVPLEVFPDDDKLQAIAQENNLSETAFITPRTDGAASFNLRWFTPALEVELCGHATLAAAHVVWTELGDERDTLAFDTRSGILTVKRDGARYTMDFPAIIGERVEPATDLIRALGREPSEVYRARNTMCVFDSKRQVLEIEPDAAGIAALDAFGVIATAPGTQARRTQGYQFVDGASLGSRIHSSLPFCSLAFARSRRGGGACRAANHNIVVRKTLVLRHVESKLDC